MIVTSCVAVVVSFVVLKSVVVFIVVLSIVVVFVLVLKSVTFFVVVLLAVVKMSAIITPGGGAMMDLMDWTDLRS